MRHQNNTIKGSSLRIMLNQKQVIELLIFPGMIRVGGV